MTAPLVSVLIPTHNRAHYVGDAIASALGQTVRDIEVVVVDDGSTDGTPALLAAIDDPRLRVVRHEVNRGIPDTRNTALEAARGRYLAWLDSDDVARPTRLFEQVAFLESRPDVAMVGAAAGKLRPDGSRRGGTRLPPLEPTMISAWLTFRSAFQQSSVTGRADLLKNYRYDPSFQVCEDVDMFLRLARDHRLANLPRLLIDRRLHPGQTIRQRQAEIRAAKMRLYAPLLARIGVATNADDLARHVLLGKATLDDVPLPSDFLDWTRDWLRRLAEANRESNVLDPASLATASAYVWLIACRAAASALGRQAVTRALLSSTLPAGMLSRPALAWAMRTISRRR